MRLTYLGHSCFLVETAKARLILDPFLNDNPTAKIKAKDVKCDFILVSHGHEDHSGDALEIAKQCDATIVANYEITEYFAAKGAKKTHGMNPGGAHTFPFGRVKLTIAHHTSSVEAGLKPVYLGVPCGMLIQADGKAIYHAGDTALFMDMQLIGRVGLDAAMIPIGDNFTMGPEDAVTALDFLKPKLAIPIHYNTWPIIAQDGPAFAAQAAKSGHTVRALKAGETIEL
ncbi:MAG: metal-dependent hydrolase [Opitutaceae bacterium]|nr:metal-dependent hydrolase [Opitutaceae bacterium]